MITSLSIYAFLKIPDFLGSLEVASWLICIIVSISSAIAIPAVMSDFGFTFDAEDEKNKVFLVIVKLAKKIIITSFIIGMVLGLVPTRKEIAIIYFAPKIINNEDVQEMPKNIVKLANEGTKLLLQQLRDELKAEITGGVE
jgi:hypothetical protein